MGTSSAVPKVSGDRFCRGKRVAGAGEIINNRLHDPLHRFHGDCPDALLDPERDPWGVRACCRCCVGIPVYHKPPDIRASHAPVDHERRVAVFWQAQDQVPYAILDGRVETPAMVPGKIDQCFTHAVFDHQRRKAELAEGKPVRRRDF